MQDFKFGNKSNDFFSRFVSCYFNPECGKERIKIKTKWNCLVPSVLVLVAHYTYTWSALQVICVRVESLNWYDATDNDFEIGNIFQFSFASLRIISILSHSHSSPERTNFVSLIRCTKYFLYRFVDNIDIRRFVPYSILQQQQHAIMSLWCRTKPTSLFRFLVWVFSLSSVSCVYSFVRSSHFWLVTNARYSLVRLLFICNAMKIVCARARAWNEVRKRREIKIDWVSEYTVVEVENKNFSLFDYDPLKQSQSTQNRSHFLRACVWPFPPSTIQIDDFLIRDVQCYWWIDGLLGERRERDTQTHKHQPTKSTVQENHLLILCILDDDDDDDDNIDDDVDHRSNQLTYNTSTSFYRPKTNEFLPHVVSLHGCQR